MVRAAQKLSLLAEGQIPFCQSFEVLFGYCEVFPSLYALDNSVYAGGYKVLNFFFLEELFKFNHIITGEELLFEVLDLIA